MMSKENKYHSRKNDLDDEDMDVENTMGQPGSVQNELTDNQPSDQEPSNVDQSSLDEITSKLSAAETQRDANWDQVLRLQAEMHNIHKRHERDISHAHRFGVEKLIKELIPVVDSLEHSLTVSSNEQSTLQAMHEGIEMTLKLFYQALEKFGVKVIDPSGEAFNSQFHEAMTMQEHAEVAPNTVLKVMQKGFLLHDRLIRPARVIVSKAKA